MSSWTKKPCKPLSLAHNDEGNYFKTLTDLIVSEGLCHEDTVFRSLLCLSHYVAPLHKMLDVWSYEEDTCIKPISSAGSTNHSDISAVMRLKIENVSPSFSTFNPCPSLSFTATGDRKPSQCLNKVLLRFSKTCEF